MSDCPSKSEEEITRLAIQSLLEDARKFQRRRDIEQKATRMKPHIQMNKNFLKRLLQNHESSNGRKMAQRDSTVRGSKVEESDVKDVGAAKDSSAVKDMAAAKDPAAMKDMGAAEDPAAVKDTGASKDMGVAKDPSAELVEKRGGPKDSTGNGATVEQEGSKTSSEDTSVADDKEDILLSLDKAIKGEGEDDEYDQDIDLQLRVEDDDEDEEPENKPAPMKEKADIHDETTQDISSLVNKLYQGKSGDDNISTAVEGDKAASSADTKAIKDGEEAGDVIQPSSIIVPEKTQSTEYTVKDKSQNIKTEDFDDDDDDDDDNLIIEISDSDSESYNATDVKRARISPSED